MNNDLKSKLADMSAEERAELLEELQKTDKNQKVEKRKAYESLRETFIAEVANRANVITKNVSDFKDWLDKESASFREVMAEYGELNGSQKSFTIRNGKFKIEVRSNNVKRFDERADMAAEKLMDYLSKYIDNTEKGKDDPMYQLAMSLLERNRQGDLDYKSISKLYDMESKFDAEYSSIMDLFRESNVIEATAINYYFSQLGENGVWHRLEPSFCRL